MNVPIINRQNELILDYLKKKDTKNKKLIEFCCGEGKNLGYLSKKIKFEGLVGVDFSKKAIDVALKKNIPAKFVCSDIFDFKDKDKFDIILCLMSLEHFKDDKKAIKLISKFVKDNGKIIISVPAHKKKYSNADKIIGHYRRYDVKDLVMLSKEINFRINKLLCFGFPIANIYTWMYNSYLKLKNKDKLLIENTKKSGIENINSNLAIKAGNTFLFNLLSKIIRLDFIFLKTKLGTHYLMVMEKK